MPDTVTSLVDSVFQGCSKLSCVTLSTGLSKIPQSAFHDTGLESISIPDGIKIIDYYAFDNCTALESVTFSGTSSLQTIDNDAFYGDSALTAIFIPSGVTFIGNLGKWRIIGNANLYKCNVK